MPLRGTPFFSLQSPSHIKSPHGEAEVVTKDGKVARAGATRAGYLKEAREAGKEDEEKVSSSVPVAKEASVAKAASGPRRPARTMVVTDQQSVEQPVLQDPLETWRHLPG